MPVDHPFAIVPLAMVGSVSASAVCVYAALAEAANSHQVSWPSKAKIGEQTGLSARTVQRCIAELSDEGWIRVEERRRSNGSQASNAYVVFRVRETLVSPPPETLTTPPPETLMSPLEPDPLEPDPKGLFGSYVHTGHPQAAGLPVEVEDPFDAWWAAYPRKVKKPAARKAYASAAKKVGHERLMEAMLAYRERDDRVARGFAMHPSTWLNQECWDDEIIGAPVDSEEAQLALLRSQMHQKPPEAS